MALATIRWPGPSGIPASLHVPDPAIPAKPPAPHREHVSYVSAQVRGHLRLPAVGKVDGIHDIHMNQGNSQHFRQDDGVWQDGGLLLHYPAQDQWVGIFLAFLIFYWVEGARVHPTAAIALTPLLLLLMAGLSLGAGIIVSALTTRYRDLQQLVAFGVQLMMFATPVVYPLSMIGGGSFRWLILANPMTPIVEAFRYAYLGSGTFTAGDLIYSAGFTAVVLFLGIVLFNHVERTFMDTV